jgi:hypothetical protein
LFLLELAGDLNWWVDITIELDNIENWPVSSNRSNRPLLALTVQFELCITVLLVGAAL